jgi:hypothetical protein
LYGCGTWYLTPREEHRLRVLEKRVLRKIFGPKSDEEMGGWRKLHDGISQKCRKHRNNKYEAIYTYVMLCARRINT